MRYHIDTIPVWDAMKLEDECLLCALRRKTELGEADRCLGASVMEPDIRVKVNQLGFCAPHQQMLWGMGNRLGHALMMETNADETRKRMAEHLERIRKAARAYSDSGMVGRLGKNGQNAKASFAGETAKLAELSHSCILCDSIRENMRRYLHTFFHLYQNDAEFKRRFEGGKGVCLPHAAELLEAAAEELPARALGDFAEVITRLENDAFERIEGDIRWFIKKFDYRFLDEPWKDSKDAVERTVNKLRGWCVGEEPNPKE